MHTIRFKTIRRLQRDKFYETSVLQSGTKCKMADEQRVWRNAFPVSLRLHKNARFPPIELLATSEALHLQSDARAR